MGAFQLRRNYLEKDLERSLFLLNDYEDKLLVENDPKQILSIESQIESLNQRIEKRISELEQTDWVAREKLFNVEHIEDSNQISSLPEDDSNLKQIPENPSDQNTNLEDKEKIVDLRDKSQIFESIDFVNELLKKETHDEDDLKNFNILRLEIYITALLIEQIPRRILETSEVSPLYLRRENFNPIVPELRALLRMLISDTSGYKPGWFWFRTFNSEGLESIVLSTAFSDPYDWVKQQAFYLAGSAKIELPDDKIESIKWLVSNESSEVREAALFYLGKVGNKIEHLRIIWGAFADLEKNVIYQAEVSKLLVSARIKPDDAYLGLIKNEGLRYSDIKDIIEELSSTKEKIKQTSLLKGLDISNTEIKLFSVNELIRRNEFTDEFASKLKEDHDGLIKTSVILYLMSKGVDLEEVDVAIRPLDTNKYFSPPYLIDKRPPESFDWDQIILAFYKKYNYAQLLNMSNWNEIFGHTAYFVLGIDHFSKFAEKLRDDLNNNFEPEVEKYYQHQLEEKRKYYEKPEASLLKLSTRLFGSRNDEWTAEKSAEYDVKSKRHEYITAALSSLSLNGSPSDVEFGRKFLFHEEKDIQIEALKIIQKWGDSQDITNLVEIAKSTDGIAKKVSTEAALSISGNKKEVIDNLLETDDQIISSIVFASLILAEKDITDEFIKPYLKNDKKNTRIRAMGYFIFRHNEEELEELLNEYLQAEYYYDVVCYFDRILYAPKSLRSFYVKSLKENFFGELASI